MVTHSIIKKSELEGALRLDAEYYQSEYLDIKRKLESIPTKTIEEISQSVISFGAYSLCNFIEWQESGVPYLNVQNIKDDYIDFDNVKFISEETDKVLKKSKVEEGQVLLTMAGTIGNTAVAHKIPEKVNSNQAIAKITLKKDFSPYYLSAFLNSHYGNKQTERVIVSSVQPNIFLGQIKEFKVPLAIKKEQQEVEKIYRDGLNELENSKNLYSQAEDLLLEELGLKNFEKEVADLPNFAVVNLSQVKKAGRIDAEYFQAIHKRMIERVEARLKILTVSDIFDFSRGIFVPVDYYTNEKTKRPFIRIKELTGRVGINEQEVVFVNEKYPNDTKNTLLENDLVVAIIGDTIGKANLIKKELAGGFCSNNMARLRIKKEWLGKFLPEFAEILFQSPFIQKQIRQKMAQTGQPKINDKELKNIAIPILPQKTQQKIAGLVQKSHQARQKAKELLAQAKQKVEDLVEIGFTRLHRNCHSDGSAPRISMVK